MKFTKWGLLVVCLGAAGFAVKHLVKSPAQANAEQVREMATRGLAEYLARTRPACRPLIFSNPFARRPGTLPAIVKMEDAGLRGLLKGWEGRITSATIVHPELKPGAADNPQSFVSDPESTTPLSYLVAPDAFDNQAKLHPDCDLMVSLIGLPAELDRCEIWTHPGPPAFALLLPDLGIIGGTEAIRQAVNSGKLLAFVLRRPGAPSDSESGTGDSAVEFEKRFVLVTRDNFEEAAKTLAELK